jgi:hypothetical protein
MAIRGGLPATAMAHDARCFGSLMKRFTQHHGSYAALGFKRCANPGEIATDDHRIDGSALSKGAVFPYIVLLARARLVRVCLVTACQASEQQIGKEGHQGRNVGEQQEHSDRG